MITVPWYTNLEVTYDLLHHLVADDFDWFLKVTTVITENVSECNRQKVNYDDFLKDNRKGH